MNNFSRQSPHGAGADKSHPLITPELNLVPFPPGRYSVSIARLDHPAREIGGVMFPNVLASVFPSSAGTTIDGKNSSWIIGLGNPVIVEVNAPGAIVVFITMRPADHGMGGLHVNIVKLGQEVQAMGLSRPSPDRLNIPENSQANQQGNPFAPPFAGQADGYLFGGAGTQAGPGVSTSQAPPLFRQATAGKAAPPLNTIWPGAFASQPSMRNAASAPGAMPAGGIAQAHPFGSPAMQPGFRPVFSTPGVGGAPSTRSDDSPQPSGDTPSVQVCGHIQGRGEVISDAGIGVGSAGSGLRLEAVAFKTEGIAPGDLEYATITHDGKMSPWTSFPYFSGSRGLDLPLKGFVARLGGEASALYDVVYSGTFVRAGRQADCINGGFLHSSVPGDALESLWLRILPKV